MNAPSDTHPPRRRGLRALLGAAYVALFVGASALAMRTAWPGRTMNVESDAYLSTARAITRGGPWPMVGGEVPPTPLKVGPAYEFLVALVLRASEDPSAVSAVAAACFGAAVAITAALGDRWFGAPWGIAAALTMALAEAPQTVLRDSAFRHHEMVFLPLTIGVGALVEWARGRGDRALVVHHAAMAVATQMHAMAVVVVYASLGVAAWIRPSATRRGLALSAGAWVIAYAPWLAYFVRRPPRYWGFGGEGGERIAPDAGLPWSVVAAALLVHAVTLRWRGTGGEHEPASPAYASLARRALLVVLASAAANAWLGGAHWQPRYDYVFLPTAPLLVAGAAAVAVRAFRRGGLAARIAGAALVAVGAVNAARWSPGAWWQAVGRGAARPGATSSPGYHAQVGIVRALREAGFRRDDLLSRVHGWNRLHGAQNYLGQWLLPSGGGDHAPAVLLGPCAEELGGFARWWRRLDAGDGTRVIAVYAPRIRDLRVSVLDGGETRWSGPVSLPCTTEMRCSGVEPCAPSASLGGEHGAGICPDDMTMALRVARAPSLAVDFALAPAPSARVIVVRSAQAAEVSARVARGRAVDLGATPGREGRDTLARWSVRTDAPDVAAEVSLTVRVEMPYSMWLDVYEVPSAACAGR